MLVHHALVQVRRSEGVFLGNRVEVTAISNDGARESLRKFRARLGYLADRLCAAGIVVAGVNAVLVDRGCCTQHAQWVEEMDLVALFGQADGRCRAVNAGSGYSDLHSHSLLSTFFRARKTVHQTVEA